MDKTEIRQYLRESLQVFVNFDVETQRLEVRIVLEGDEIDSDNDMIQPPAI